MWSTLLLVSPQIGYYGNPAQSNPSFGNSFGGELLFSASITRKTSTSILKLGTSGIIDRFSNQNVDSQSKFSSFRVYANVGTLNGKDKLFLKPFATRTGIMIPGFIFINVESFGVSVNKSIYHGPEFFAGYKRDILSTDNTTFIQAVKNLSKHVLFLGFDSYRKSPLQLHASGGIMFYDNATTSMNETRKDYYAKLKLSFLPEDFLSVSAGGTYKHSNEPRYVKYIGNGEVDVSYDLSESISAEATINAYYTAYPNANSTEQGIDSSLELNYKFNDRLSLGLITTYTTQKSDQIDGNWVSWFAGATLNYIFSKKKR